MNDYPQFTIYSKLPTIEVRDILREEMPDFSWRAGDSDAIGGYVSGRNPERVTIKIWTGDDPYEVAIAYSVTSIDEADWPEITQRFLDIVSARIGKISPIDPNPLPRSTDQS